MGPFILYVCQNAIGDIVTSLPSIHFLKRTYPSSTLSILVNADLADIFDADPNVDRVIYHPANWYDTNFNIDISDDVEDIFGLRSHYDIVVDSMCVEKTARIIEHLNPDKAIGIGFEETLYAYSLPLSLAKWRTWSGGDRTAVECFGDLVELLNVNYCGCEPVLFLTSEARDRGKEWIDSIDHSKRPVVALNPGAGSPIKRWPFEKYIEVAQNLRSDGFLPLFIFGPRETDLFSSYSDLIAQNDCTVYYSETIDVQPLAGILHSCALLISNDCGVMHIGAAIGCRVLALFGPTSSRIWFPYRIPWNQVIEHDFDCRKSCYSGCEQRQCLSSISVNEVLSKVRCML
ncbi:MAG: glycosyltransferase family 9 protein [Methanothrix sp.]|nr:glycosyltransferase family 9 protein [Methanothrix sp.]